MHRWAFDAIGTRWEIETAQELPASLRAEVEAAIDDFDITWSRFRTDSVVSSLRGGGTAPLPLDADHMLSAYAALSRATDAAVNPLIGASLEALGYDASVTLQPGEPVASAREWERMLRWDEDELTLTGPAVIDVGALGKGRLVDLVLDTLQNMPGRVTVDAGGDLRVRGGPLRVALEHPYDATAAIGVIDVRDRALCASAVNRRAWGSGLHHVLDGRTGRPVRRWVATWAIAVDAMHADGAATALFFDGGPGIAQGWGVEWVRMSTDGRAECSPGFTGELFVENASSMRVHTEEWKL